MKNEEWGMKNQAALLYCIAIFHSSFIILNSKDYGRKIFITNVLHLSGGLYQ